MKLISLYVEQYGAISAREYRFDDGLCVFCEENGAGKTTLASFIKAMFYGLEPYRSNTKEFCDRQHFYPFAGGNFGGNLTFEWEGHTYKIERFFGEKSDLADTLTVYCDGAVTDRFTGEIGREVFGIDKASFERTLFVDSAEMECAATADIGAKLNRFLQGTGEETDLDSALGRLDKAATRLKKKRGQDSEIGRTKAEITALEEKLRNAERVREGLSAKYETYDANNARIAALTEQVTAAQTQNALLADFAHYEYLLQSVQENKVRLQNLNSAYPKGLPTRAELEQFGAMLAEQQKNRALAEKPAFGEQDEAILSGLAAVFASGVPSEARLAEAEREIQAIAALQAQIAAAEQSTVTEEESRLVARFAAREVSDGDLDALAANVSACTAAQKAYHETPATVAQPVPTAPRGTRKYALFALLALALAIVGAVVLFQNALVGGIIAAVGVAALLAVAFLYLNHKMSTRGVVPTECENPDKQRLALEWRTAEVAAAGALGAFGYSAEGGVELTFFRLREDVKQYRALLEREEARRAALARDVVQRETLQTSLHEFFVTYRLEGDTHINALTRLRAAIGEYRAQSNRKKVAEHGREELGKRMRELDAKIATFCEKYALESPDMQRLFEDLHAHKTLLDAIRDGEAEAERYRAEKGLVKKPEGEAVDIAALNVELGELRDVGSRLLRAIEEDERLAGEAERYRGERDEAKEHLAALEHRYRMLSAATELLKGADQSLKDRYFKPVKDRFVYYSDLIERTIGERVSMSGNFKLTFERHGKERSERHLSMGQRAICALCFRLALIENMYDGATPFLVLDDPFMALDAAHLACVKEVLQEVSSHTQILYFCCHESRAV